MSVTKLQGIDLLRALCLEFGPSSCEDNVADLIEAQIGGICEVRRNRLNHVIAHLPGTGENLPRIMLSAHMDEVGMMITSIDDNGFLRFVTVGGIDGRVLCGRKVQVGNETGRVPGVIGAKAIHLQSADERKQTTPTDKLYIDIGAKNREQAEKYVDVGDFATFDSDFVLFGQDKRRMRSKAIDDRLGCAVMVEVLRALVEAGGERPFDLWCAFTGREEVGKSGAKVAGYEIQPDYAIILEATAIADLPDVPACNRVSDVGRGGTISYADKGTLYEPEFVQFALDCGARENVPCQVKRYVAGGNDARHIQQAAGGVHCLNISCPTRYIHGPSCVAAVDDYAAVRDLVLAMLKHWDERA